MTDSSKEKAEQANSRVPHPRPAIFYSHQETYSILEGALKQVLLPFEWQVIDLIDDDSKIDTIISDLNMAIEPKLGKRLDKEKVLWYLKGYLR